MRGALGIAGVNTRPLHAAVLGIAGNWGSTLRPHLAQVVGQPGRARRTAGSGLGDRAAGRCWAHAVYLLDYAYVSCPDRVTGRMRCRAGLAAMCSPATRTLPLYLDSGAFREAHGTAPAWSSYRRYCEAITLLRPDGAMAKDVLHDQAASLAGFERMVADGYGDLAIPLWHARPAWVAGLSVRENARLAAADPTLRRYADGSPLVAIGGLAHGPCPRDQRHVYLAELCRAFPDLRLWALGQASRPVVNGLGTLGLLDRVSVDGSWWIVRHVSPKSRTAFGSVRRGTAS